MLSGSELQGESYFAFRDRVRSLRLPLVEAHRAAFDVMYACNEENVAKVSTLSETSPGIADTDEAQAKIERLQELNQAYMRLIDADPPGTSNDAVRSVEGAIRVNEDLIASLRDVIYQIEDYVARSVGHLRRAVPSLSRLEPGEDRLALVADHVEHRLRQRLLELYLWRRSGCRQRWQSVHR